MLHILSVTRGLLVVADRGGARGSVQAARGWRLSARALVDTPASCGGPPTQKVPQNINEFGDLVRERRLFDEKGAIPRGIISDAEARQVAKMLLPGERKMLYNALRQRTIDQYEDHRKLGTADVDSDTIKIIVCINFFPYLLWGMFDNGLLILMSENLDRVVQQYLAISMMGAAAVSNTMTNFLGVWMPGFAVKLANVMGWTQYTRPVFTAEQLNNQALKVFTYWSRAMGVVVGCAIGCLPLLYFEDPKLIHHGDEFDREVDDHPHYHDQTAPPEKDDENHYLKGISADEAEREHIVYCGLMKTHALNDYLTKGKVEGSEYGSVGGADKEDMYTDRY